MHLGDRNTKFFHSSVVSRRRRNWIDGIRLDNGVWCTDDETIQHQAVNYYRSLFAEEVGNRWRDKSRDCGNHFRGCFPHVDS